MSKSIGQLSVYCLLVEKSLESSPAKPVLFLLRVTDNLKETASRAPRRGRDREWKTKTEKLTTEKNNRETQREPGKNLHLQTPSLLRTGGIDKDDNYRSPYPTH